MGGAADVVEGGVHCGGGGAEDGGGDAEDQECGFADGGGDAEHNLHLPFEARTHAQEGHSMRSRPEHGTSSSGPGMKTSPAAASACGLGIHAVRCAGGGGGGTDVFSGRTALTPTPVT